MHHSLISCLLSLLYLKVAIELDDELMLLCEKIGFVKKSSRKWKFYNFVFYLTLMLLAAILVSTLPDFYVFHPEWMVNYSKQMK
jgi:hypothetical protein